MARRGEAPPVAANPLGTLAEQIAAARRLAEGRLGGDLPSDQYRYMVGRTMAIQGLPLLGRPPGTAGVTDYPRATTNRRNMQGTHFSIRGMAEILIENGYDPAEEMVRILKGEPDPENPGERLYRVDSKVRLQFSNELLKYVYPQRKAVEVEQRVQYSGAELDAQLGSAIGRLLATGGGMADTLIAEAVRTIEDCEAAEPERQALCPGPAILDFDPWSMI